MIDYKIFGGVQHINKLLIVSLGGLKQLTLEEVKKRFNGANIVLGIDNDEPANEFYNKHGKGLPRLNIPLKYGKDWNDVLKVKRKEV